MNPKVTEKSHRHKSPLKRGPQYIFFVCGAVLNAQILLGKKRCMNYTALFMVLHLELVFSPLCMCSIAVPKIDMVTNIKLVELGI